MQSGETTGASQQTLLTIIKSWVTTPCGGLQDHIFAPAQASGDGPHFAPSEVGFYSVQLNLEHI